MNNNSTKTELVTIKVTKETVKNFKIAAAYAEKTVYEVAEEWSVMAKRRCEVSKKIKK